METALAFLTGAMVAGSIYLILSRNLVRFIFGLVLMSNAINLLIFTAGRLGNTAPPILPPGGAAFSGRPMANALPQALILTAIVIGFALLAFIFVLFYRAYEAMQTVDMEAMRVAEPRQNDNAANRRPSSEAGAAPDRAEDTDGTSGAAS